MLINAHHQMERLVDLRDRAFHIKNHSVRKRVDDPQTIRPGKFVQRDKIFRSRTKAVSELCHTQVAAKAGAGGIVDFSDQAVESILVSQWQRNGQIQKLCAGKLGDETRLTVGYCER